jgi:hypothetical protein
MSGKSSAWIVEWKILHKVVLLKIRQLEQNNSYRKAVRIGKYSSLLEHRLFKLENMDNELMYVLIWKFSYNQFQSHCVKFSILQFMLKTFHSSIALWAGNMGWLIHIIVSHYKFFLDTGIIIVNNYLNSNLIY